MKKKEFTMKKLDEYIMREYKGLTAPQIFQKFDEWKEEFLKTEEGRRRWAEVEREFRLMREIKELEKKYGE